MFFKITRDGPYKSDQNKRDDHYGQYNMCDKHKIINVPHPSLPTIFSGIGGNMMCHVHDKETY